MEHQTSKVDPRIARACAGTMLEGLECSNPPESPATACHVLSQPSTVTGLGVQAAMGTKSTKRFED
jgi:hypothetical protein